MFGNHGDAEISIHHKVQLSFSTFRGAMPSKLCRSFFQDGVRNLVDSYRHFGKKIWLTEHLGRQTTAMTRAVSKAVSCWIETSERLQT